MTTAALETAPVLSTPDTHIFEDPTPPVDTLNLPRLSNDQIRLTYEIERTVKEIRDGRWKRIALQFPDHMLVDAPRVFEALKRGLVNLRNGESTAGKAEEGAEEDEVARKLQDTHIADANDEEEKLFILGDTSYGACCVDEVAAEHVDADVVVHYGRSCLSPPSRLPVIYIFTTPPLDLDAVISAFKETYREKEKKVVLMADIPYAHHISSLYARLEKEGYTDLWATDIIHDPSSLLPNRTVPPDTTHSQDGTGKEVLREYSLFHISEPPTSLLLTLSSRLSSIHIYPTTTGTSPTTSTPQSALPTTTTTTLLRRRYALLTSLSTVSVFGILINTLSVKNYMHILSHVQSQIAAAGKKSYTFVVGKVNAAKVANFSEVGGWVVIGCWESSLIESGEFWKPLVTPFELGMALMGDGERVWTGEWRGDFMAVLEEGKEGGKDGVVNRAEESEEPVNGDENGDGEYDSEEESQPPEFDLRTGRYVSHSRPLRSTTTQLKPQQTITGASAAPSSALTKRLANGDIAHVGGVLSPGAEYLRSQRTWQGLGSDYAAQEEEDGGLSGRGARMEEGRSGIARGYVVGRDGIQH